MWICNLHSARVVELRAPPPLGALDLEALDLVPVNLVFWHLVALDLRCFWSCSMCGPRSPCIGAAPSWGRNRSPWPWESVESWPRPAARCPHVCPGQGPASCSSRALYLSESAKTGFGQSQAFVKSISFPYCVLRLGLVLLLPAFSLIEILLRRRGGAQEVPS